MQTSGLRLNTKLIKNLSAIFIVICLTANAYGQSSEELSAEEEIELSEYAASCEVEKLDCQDLRQEYEILRNKQTSFWDSNTGKVVIFTLGIVFGAAAATR